MKKFITLLIGCSLALAATAIAQQDEEQGKVKKKQDQTEKSQPANEAKPATKPKVVPKEHAEPRTHGQNKMEPTESASPKMHHDMTKHAGQEPANTDANVTGQEHGMKGKKEHGMHTESAITEKPANTDANVSGEEHGMKGKKEHGMHTGSATTEKPAGPTTGGGTGVDVKEVDRQHSQTSVAVDANRPNLNVNANVNAHTKVNVEKVTARGGRVPDIQTIRSQHASFRAQPRPDKVPAVTFNQSYRINGSDRWQGEKYSVFRSYHPERHDRGWYSAHYPRVELIGGGYYYWNGGYWYPAWGYDSSAEYYAYDGPVYVGSSAAPPDQVIADVQAALQEMGYYKGEVDGLLGPLTREALTAYQEDNGLYTTATIDEPTMESLGMG